MAITFGTMTEQFRRDETYYPPADTAYVFLEVWGGAARIHFRIGIGEARSTDWMPHTRARARALEIARLESLATPLVEREGPLPASGS